ncbi:Gp19/Gp15/Gp42 family protein [Mycolicibacterium smegmatis]|uniref:Phage protein Gp19/Gp15/Gp42 n=1 Tax=Mycolicibacterium smegmatis (strain MKD8) TaxID=1214915 RepID=A0A2U9PQ37_MYCSE|nr:Gp19/Gp15/Gp42 family protein [Mycolicibacterium smegmatis]AWT53861.1 Phage protein Gp19/Gp15/Gp42 [Mycolicibacterium smegmatis MKD8]
MAYATPSDVSARLGRPLTDDEETQVETFLEDAEIEIRSRIPDLNTRAEDPGYLQRVVRVEASAVTRLIRNPDGYIGETDGNYSYQLNWRLNTGQIEITDQEWSLLGLSKTVGILDVRPLTPRERAQAASQALGGVHPFMLGMDLTDPYHGGIGWAHEFDL